MFWIIKQSKITSFFFLTKYGLFRQMVIKKLNKLAKINLIQIWHTFGQNNKTFTLEMACGFMS